MTEEKSTKTTKPCIWVLLDTRAGHQTQALGVAERLADEAHIVSKPLAYTRLAALGNRLLGAHLWHLSSQARQSLVAPWPDVVIGCGRRTAPVARWIKKRSPTTRLVHIMWPGAGAGDFECLAVPEHDHVTQTLPSLLRTAGAPHRVTPELLQAEVASWQSHMQRLPRPYIAVLVGGDAKHTKFEEADYKTLAAYAAAEAERLGGALLISTSPRTNAQAEAWMKPLLTVPHYLHCWNAGSVNPFLGFLGLADAVIVTSDSVSMCSEACSIGKPVYIFSPPHQKAYRKKDAYLQMLVIRGYAKPHTYPVRLDWVPTPYPDVAGMIADKIRTMLSTTSA